MAAARSGLSRSLRNLAIRAFPRAALRWGQLDGDALGAAGEELAARTLARQGLRVLARRLPTPAAELDLLVDDGRSLIVVEVKTGRSGRDARGLDPALLRWRPLDRVSPRQMRRLERAAAWLARRTRRRVRVDLVEVLVDRRGRTRVEHIAGAGGSTNF